MRARSAATLLLALTAAAAVGAAVPPGNTADLPYFTGAADRMLSGSWAETYSDASLQVGPLQLLLFALPSTALIGAVAGALSAGLFWLIARRFLADAQGWALLAASLAPVVLGLTFHAYRQGHPAQVLVPLLWVIAGLELRRGRAWTAGAVIGLSAGFEVWGLLGVAVFGAAPTVRLAMRAVASTSVLALSLYAPFWVAGDFAMFEYRWAVSDETLISLFLEPGTEFPWSVRILQGGTALLVGSVLTRMLRRSPAALWVGPLALVAVRVALDPVRYPWYWLALETLALVGAVHLGGELLSRRALEAAHRGAARCSRAPLPAPRSAPRTS